MSRMSLVGDRIFSDLRTIARLRWVAIAGKLLFKRRELKSFLF